MIPRCIHCGSKYVQPRYHITDDGQRKIYLDCKVCLRTTLHLEGGDVCLNTPNEERATEDISSSGGIGLIAG